MTGPTPYEGLERPYGAAPTHVQQALEAVVKRLQFAIEERQAWLDGKKPNWTHSDFRIVELGESIAALGKTYAP